MLRTPFAQLRDTLFEDHLYFERAEQAGMLFALSICVVCFSDCALHAKENQSVANTQHDHLDERAKDTVGENNFGQDVEFLNRYVQTCVLGNNSSKALVAVVPAYQGRVMTSSAAGRDGTSFGWINYAHIQANEITPHIHVFGGGERFWLGPEGGQFGIFFPAGSEFEYSEWQTPALIDTIPFAILEQNERSVVFQHESELTNYSGTTFHIRVYRKVEIIESLTNLDVGNPGLSWVGYRTTNRLTNTGHSAWSKRTGLLSIWLLGMYKHGAETTVVIPFKRGSDVKLGMVVNDDYFGQVPQERLAVGEGVLFFSGDGNYRSKIGLTPQRATDICGSYDAKRRVLTIVKYNQPGPEVTDYVNSMWEIQEEPYAGDVLNSYNDGPPEPDAKPLGPFYELETSSPAFALKPNETGEHVQETYHFEGSTEELDRLSRKLLGVSLAEIREALPR